MAKYKCGGKMYFLGSDLSFGDYLKNNPQAVKEIGMPMASLGSMGAGVISAVEKKPSMAGALGKGALQGASAGAMLGPIGMAGGAAIGAGLGFLGQKRADAAEALAYDQASLAKLGSANRSVDPNMHTYALGGVIPRLTEFDEGGTHEENPNGGVPQGINKSNGQPNLVEEGESKFKNYIFSDRLKISAPKEYNLGGHLNGVTFAEASKRLSRIADERPNDPIATRGQEMSLNRLKMANEDAIAMQQFNDSNPQGMESHYNSKDRLSSKSTFKYGGFIFKDI